VDSGWSSVLSARCSVLSAGSDEGQSTGDRGDGDAKGGCDGLDRQAGGLDKHCSPTGHQLPDAVCERIAWEWEWDHWDGVGDGTSSPGQPETRRPLTAGGLVLAGRRKRRTECCMEEGEGLTASSARSVLTLLTGCRPAQDWNRKPPTLLSLPSSARLITGTTTTTPTAKLQRTPYHTVPHRTVPYGWTRMMPDPAKPKAKPNSKPSQ